MNHSFVDSEVQNWAKTYSLRVSYGFGGRELWAAYLSSVGGECFQIWIEPMTDVAIGVHAGYIDGPNDREPEPERVWTVDEGNLKNTLELAYEQVLNWMVPSVRYFP